MTALPQAQDKYRVPDDICAQSIGGGAAGVSSAAAGGQRTLGSASSAKDVKAIFEVLSTRNRRGCIFNGRSSQPVLRQFGLCCIWRDFILPKCI